MSGSEDWRFLCGVLRKTLWQNRADSSEWTFRQELSIVKQLVKRWGMRETEAMIRGAHLLGWTDLRAVNATDGVGRRWALTAYWQEQNRHGGKIPERVRKILRDVLSEDGAA